MLLGDFLLSQSPHKYLVGHIWREREKTEREAASLFAELALGMRQCGLPENLVAMAQEASDDEIDHASRCRDIIAECQFKEPLLDAKARGLLGPRDFSLEKRVLYTSAAMGCVTETVSTALLLEMKKRMDAPIIEKTVRAILGDEVNHSRLGWTHLAYYTQTAEADFLGAYLPRIFESLLIAESDEASDKRPEHCDVYGLGVLPRLTVERVFKQTLEEVILPGFEEFGVPTELSHAWCRDRFGS